MLACDVRCNSEQHIYFLYFAAETKVNLLSWIFQIKSFIYPQVQVWNKISNLIGEETWSLIKEQILFQQLTNMGYYYFLNCMK